MATKQGRFDLEWWVVQKRLIYIIVAALAFALLAAGAWYYVSRYGNPFAGQRSADSGPEGARFASFEGDVRVIRASTRETLPASLQTQLYPGDTVQTQSDGRARITLADGSTLLIRPNSTVIIRDNTSAEGGRNIRVRVDTGQINVRTEQQPEGSVNVVETSQTQSRLASETASSFNVNPDKTAEIRVHTGQIETTTNNGEKTVIRSNEYVSVNPVGSIGQRERLLDVPAPSGPRNLERIQAGGAAANVRLQWQRPQSGLAAHYRVEVATSPFFVTEGKVIERDQLASNEFNASDLRPGDYFWRVRATARSGQASDWSEPQKFTVVTKGGGAGGPSFNEVAAEYVGGRIYVIRGRTEPGTTISYQGRGTLSDSNGSFRLQITAPEGAGEVSIEAEDQQGNRTRHKVQLAGGTAAAAGARQRS